MKLNLSQLISTLSQPSTYAGLAGLAIAGGVTEPKYNAITTALATVFGVAAVVMNEAPANAVATVLQDGVEVASAVAPNSKAVVVAEQVAPLAEGVAEDVIK